MQGQESDMIQAEIMSKDVKDQKLQSCIIN